MATSWGYDFAELDQALFLYLDGQEQSGSQEHRQTLNIFPSQPMHVEPSNSKGPISLIPNTSSTSKGPSNQSMEPGKPRTETGKGTKPTVKREGNNGKATVSNSDQEGPKTPDPKTLRRLAQNREAARKSRLRKKAYIQQLESSRIRLSQIEQELQRSRAQGVLFGGGASGGLLGEQGLPTSMGGLSSDAAMFDLEYGRWLEEHHKIMCQLRAALEEHLPENQLRMFVESTLSHYEVLMNLKSIVAKSDVFHLFSGMWKTPTERCFLWIGDFRPSELIKIVLRHIEPLSEQQFLGICGLQQSMQESEEALNQGLEALHHSLSETINSDVLSSPSNMANYMGHMSVAINKLTALEGFVRQADNLRQQTLHRLQQILTTQQSARCFLEIAEYFHRLRALSSLWIARPRQDGPFG
ncbi:transcription factor HBP-1b(c38)-like isoform X2 [Ananas comosus]|uniref:Transcription factor HBP-1b(C38)-like isoform X2 n=1 Tax=Ananas comosus TaxID=4615 RepID=A0A6P5GMU9_ANACO|nr:transcription factor HBP-1b(c38)-like isoform X2 [Ananas comosus]